MSFIRHSHRPTHAQEPVCSYSVEGLQTGTSYLVRVAAVNSLGVGGFVTNSATTYGWRSFCFLSPPPGDGKRPKKNKERWPLLFSPFLFFSFFRLGMQVPRALSRPPVSTYPPAVLPFSPFVYFPRLHSLHDNAPGDDENLSAGHARHTNALEYFPALHGTSAM